MDVQGAIKALQSRVRFAREAAQAYAFDAKTDMAEAWRTGLGVPHFITGVSSFACFAVAAGGTVALSGDFIGKFYGPRECDGCNGWEGVLCRLCNGSGRAPFTLRHSHLRNGEEPSPANVASAVVEGRADVAFIPRSMGGRLPLPQTTCPTCAGSGVMKCTLCKGDAWKNKISFTKMCASPTLAWDVVRKNKGVHTPPYPTDHPAVAQFAETLHQPLQSLPGEWQEKLKWQNADALVAAGPGRAARNPVAVLQQEAAREAAGARPPPRPRNWGEERLSELVPLPDISGLKTAAERVGWEEVGRQQAGVKGQALDALWAEDWRRSKEDEIFRRKAEAALQALKAEPLPPPRPAVVVEKVVEAPPPLAPTKKGKAQSAAKIKEGQKEAAKKEREEKKALLARRAAEREKALAEAKRR